VLARQLRNPLLLLLLLAAAVASAFGHATDAVIIFVICGLSIGLGFVNDVRSERSVDALHSRLRHTAVALRDRTPATVDVTEVVPGGVVRIGVGDLIPADLRLLLSERGRQD
jgi:Mg2+-importing ATPase